MSITMQNRRNGETVVCDNPRDIRVIEGVEFLEVRHIGHHRRFLMLREALEAVKNKQT